MKFDFTDCFGQNILKVQITVLLRIGGLIYMANGSLSSEVVTRTLVLQGEDRDPARRGNKKIVARSKCRFTCPDSETLERCVEHIKASDEHLRNRPEEMMLWDWASTYVERTGNEANGGGVVILGVAWYDEAFFEANRDAYLNLSHLSKYLTIGLTNGTISVTHWKFVGSGSV